MTFCTDCGVSAEGRFCGRCGAPTSAVPPSTQPASGDVQVADSLNLERKASKASLPRELTLFRTLVLTWFLGIAPALMVAVLFSKSPVPDGPTIAGAAVVWWFIYGILAVAVIQPLRWAKMGSWKARRLAAWLFALLAALTAPQIGGSVLFWALLFGPFYYFTMRKTLDTDVVKELASDYQNARSWKKRLTKPLQQLSAGAAVNV